MSTKKSLGVLMRCFLWCCVGVCCVWAGVVGVSKGGSNGVTSAHSSHRVREGRHVAGSLGRSLWKTYCALCHGVKGEGYIADHAPAMSNQMFLASTSDRFLVEAITKGRPGTPMGAYGKAEGGPLSKAEVRALVRAIRSWQRGPSLPKKRVRPGVKARGKKVYRALCASCHGRKGIRGTAPSLGHPYLMGSISDTQLYYAITKGRPGTSMLGYKKILSARQIRDVITYIKQWQSARVPPQRARVRRVAAPKIPIGPVKIVHPKGKAPSFGALRKGWFVSAAKVHKALKAKRRMILLDARVSSDYLLFHLPGAVPSPYYAAAKIARSLPRDGTWIIAYCACPHHASGMVIKTLRKLGFRNTAVMDEGVLHWRDKGYSLTKGPKPFGPVYIAPQKRKRR